MKHILNYILESESEMLTESFKSNTLRELARDLKEICDISEKKLINGYLPKGVRWDAIPDNKVFRGESGDKKFKKDYVRDDYIIIWYPMVNYKDAVMYNRMYNSAVINAGKTYIITCGKDQFVCLVPAVQSTGGTSSSSISKFIKDITSNDFGYKLSSEDIRNSIINPNNLTLTTASRGNTIIKPANLINGDIPAIAIAISKDTLFEYSTFELVMKRQAMKYGTDTRDAEYNRYIKLNNEHRYLNKLKSTKVSNEVKTIITKSCALIKETEEVMHELDSCIGSGDMNTISDSAKKYFKNAGLEDFLGFLEASSGLANTDDEISTNARGFKTVIKLETRNLIQTIDNNIQKLESNASSGDDTILYLTRIMKYAIENKYNNLNDKMTEAKNFIERVKNNKK